MKKPALVALIVGLAVASACPGAYVPWDALQNDPVNGDNWVHAVSGVETFRLYPVNAAPILCTFDIAKTDGSARGMNALKFKRGDQMTGHMTSDQLNGSFQITNLPKDKSTFESLLVMVAIDADSLPAGWSMSLNGVALGPDDFAYVDGSAAPTGRPSGYYAGPEPTIGGPFPGTTPARDEISHLFDKGMVSIVELTGRLSLPNFPTVDVDYSFSSLGGDATFSLYGPLLDQEGNASIKHTNRGWDDLAATDDLISTFSVLAPENDPTIPEPASLLAISTCLTALVGYSRRRR